MNTERAKLKRAKTEKTEKIEKTERTKTEFGSWPPPRRWLLQPLGLAHLVPFPYR
jgi:hypothetical protein